METLSASHPNPCKFWPRIGALILDSIILGIVGFIMGLIFFDAFANMGIYGRLVGFVISISYFGILNSSIGRGQTLGKKACNIRVVGKDGKPIALLPSLIRSGILFIPFYTNGLPIFPTELFSFFTVILSVLIFGLGFSIFYLYVANKRTRQSLHDLAVGSFVVVRGEETKLEENKKVNRGHYFVCGIFTFSIVLFGLFIAPSIAKNDTFTPLLETQKDVWNLDFVSYCQVGDSTTRSTNGTFTHFNVSAVVKEKQSKGKEQFKSVAEQVFKSYPKIEERDQLRITLTYGYDIGIARSYSTQTVADTIPNWKEQIYNKSVERNGE